MAPTTTQPQTKVTVPWIEHRTIWRWHFYAGLFCIPFVTWLSITGAIYVFKPQIEAWLDKPYAHLTLAGPRASGAAQVAAALAGVCPAPRYTITNFPKRQIRLCKSSPAKVRTSSACTSIRRLCKF